VKVDWDPPSSPNGIIQGYVVSYGQTRDETTRSFNNKTHTYTFDACGGVTYKVKVWAFTVADGPKRETTFKVSIYGKKP